jgi:hypothetical protein
MSKHDESKRYIFLVIFLVFVGIVSGATYITSSYMEIDEIRADTQDYVDIASNVQMERLIFSNDIKIGENTTIGYSSKGVTIGDFSSVEGVYWNQQGGCVDDQGGSNIPSITGFASGDGTYTCSDLNYYSIAIGYNASAYGTAGYRQSISYATAIGYNAEAKSSASIAIGAESYTGAPYAIALGTLASASGYKSVAIGYNAINDVNNSLLIGGDIDEVRIDASYVLINGKDNIATGIDFTTDNYATTYGGIWLNTDNSFEFWGSGVNPFMKVDASNYVNFNTPTLAIYDEFNPQIYLEGTTNFNFAGLWLDDSTGNLQMFTNSGTLDMDENGNIAMSANATISGQSFTIGESTSSAGTRFNIGKQGGIASANTYFEKKVTGTTYSWIESSRPMNIPFLSLGFSTVPDSSAYDIVFSNGATILNDDSNTLSITEKNVVINGNLSVTTGWNGTCAGSLVVLNGIVTGCI